LPGEQPFLRGPYLVIGTVIKIVELTEKELIQGCIQNDTKCQRMLFERYGGIMMTICRRYAVDAAEAEDMLQEAFIRVFAYIDRFRFQGSLEGWLRRLTVNVALRILEHKKIRFTEIREEQPPVASDEPDAPANLSADELLNLISRLPTGYRIVFNLHVMEGYTHEEIAALLRIKPASSRSQLSKAKSLLQERIISLQKTADGYGKRSI
jgi:RNA polymerase sigma factor (sigma-70 family)